MWLRDVVQPRTKKPTARGYLSYDGKWWFPINVLVLTTNGSCLLVQTSLRFVGFHSQP